MARSNPSDFEQIPLSTTEPWIGVPDIGLTNIQIPDFDRSYCTGIDVREVIDITPTSRAQSVGSSGFVSCSGIVIRDAASQTHTFGHLQPGVMSLQRHMEGRQIEGEAVIILGDRSETPDILEDIDAGRWGAIDTKVISFDAGGMWWAAIYKVMSGEILIARPKPTPSILRYQAFNS